MAAAAGGRRTISSLLKQAYNEIPEAVGGTIHLLIGLGFGFYGLYYYSKNNLHNRKFKMSYIIMRPDDPRAALVHKDHLEPKDK